MKNALITSVSIATAISLLAGSSASAHVSIYPGVTATGSSTAALTAGQSGTLYFRAGHGCTDQTGTKSPITGVSMSGTSWPTSVFSVHIPIEATGTGTTIPKPAYIPGWKNKVERNQDGSYEVSWSAVSSDFYLPDGPDGGAGGKVFMDFGVSIKWKTGITGTDVWFPAKQTCVVDMTNKPSTKSPVKLVIDSKRQLTAAFGKARSNQLVDLKVNGEVLRAGVKLDKGGNLKLSLTKVELSSIKSTGALLTIVQGAQQLGYLGGQVASRNIYVSWDVTDGSGADTVMDDTEHNTSPKVTVL